MSFVVNSFFYNTIKYDNFLKMLLDNYKFYVENINNRCDQNFMRQVGKMAFVFAVQINYFYILIKNKKKLLDIMQ